MISTSIIKLTIGLTARFQPHTCLRYKSIPQTDWCGQSSSTILIQRTFFGNKIIIYRCHLSPKIINLAYAVYRSVCAHSDDDQFVAPSQWCLSEWVVSVILNLQCVVPLLWYEFQCLKLKLIAVFVAKRGTLRRLIIHGSKWKRAASWSGSVPFVVPVPPFTLVSVSLSYCIYP